MFWEEKIETATRETLNELQRNRLRETLGKLFQKSPFYQKLSERSISLSFTLCYNRQVKEN